MKHLTALVVIAAICSAAPLAQAQGPGGRGPDLDANGDGVVSASEFDKAGRQRFQRMDDNHDGVIDKAEVADLRKRMAERMGTSSAAGNRPDMIAQMDANKNGEITQAEVVGAQKARFKKADKNADGMLNAAEQKAMRPEGRGGPR